MKILVVSAIVFTHFVKRSHINFSFNYKEVSLFYGYFEDI